MTAQELKARIETLSSETHVELFDLTGTRDHWRAIIVSPAFEGKTRIEQHRLVFDLLKKEVDSNEVHALTLQTFSPEQYKRLNNGK